MTLNKFEEYFKDKHEFLNLDLSLKRIDNALKDINFNQESLGKVIHVAGTNGKGSTTYFLNQMISSKGYKTALFTSPHILRINERIIFNNTEISDISMDEIFLSVKDVIEKNNLSYFESIFLIALCFFAKNKPDFTILETGMGGLFDATNTNLINDKLCVIVSMGQDHSNYLGKSIKKITDEKIGIIRKDSKVIVGSNKEFIKEYIKNNSISSNIYFYNDQNRLNSDKYSILYPYPYNENYELAKIIFYNLLDMEFNDGIDFSKDYSKDSIKNEISNGNITKLKLPPCRMEEIQNIVLDGTHNIPGLLKIINTWKEYNFKHIILSLTEEKDLEKVLFFIKKVASNIIVTTIPDNSRSISDNVLPIIEKFQKENTDIRIRFIKQPIVAVDSVFKENVANKELERILITGSFYLCGYIKDYILKEINKSKEKIKEFNQLFNVYNN